MVPFWFFFFNFNLGLTTERQDIPTAFVPIIKVKASGISIDLLMARLALPSIPDDLTLENDNILLGTDKRCMRGLGGLSNYPKIIYSCLFPSRSTIGECHTSPCTQCASVPGFAMLH